MRIMGSRSRRARRGGGEREFFLHVIESEKFELYRAIYRIRFEIAPVEISEVKSGEEKKRAN